MPFDGNGTLRVAVFFSGGASGFRYLADADPAFGDAYDIVVGITDDPDAPGTAVFADHDIPVEAADIRSFYDDRDAEMSDLAVRAEYDAATRERLEPYEPDLVLLSGYMWILTAQIIDTYPTINVHPADLTIEEDGERVFVGFDPVWDAVVAGEPETRSTVHFVTTDVDAGPILVRSRPFGVYRELVTTLDRHDAEDALRSYVDAHQAWMKWAGDGPGIATALSLIAAGRVERDGATVRIDGDPGWFDLGEEAVIDSPE